MYYVIDRTNHEYKIYEVILRSDNGEVGSLQQKPLPLAVYKYIKNPPSWISSANEIIRCKVDQSEMRKLTIPLWWWIGVALLQFEFTLHFYFFGIN
jgi:hypothetical protein